MSSPATKTGKDPAESGEFSSPGNQSKMDGSASGRNRRTSTRSSFFNVKRLSFYRSGGDSGADPATLRGTTGADFEATGRIHRGAASGWCCSSSSSGKDKDRLLLIKGPFCFVFTDENAAAPKYAIGLQYGKANVKPAEHGRVPVTLEDNLGDIQYELSFETEELAKQFAHAVKAQATKAHTEEVRKRLGHEHLLTKRSSVRYAETIAKKKVTEQPEKPVTTQEVINNMPISAL